VTNIGKVTIDALIDPTIGSPSIDF